MNDCSHGLPIFNRRDFLRTTGVGFGWLAFSALQAAEKGGYVSPLAPKPGHHPARAKRVIFLFMNGGPSHLETFDWKPELKKVGVGGHHQLLGPVLDFKASGKSGLMISEAFPNLSRSTRAAKISCVPRWVHGSPTVSAPRARTSPAT